jgi:prefoldin subunit 5
LPKDQIDDLIAAVEAVEFLKEAVADQKRSIAAIVDILDQLQRRVAALEAKAAPKQK